MRCAPRQLLHQLAGGTRHSTPNIMHRSSKQFRYWRCILSQRGCQLVSTINSTSSPNGMWPSWHVLIDLSGRQLVGNSTSCWQLVGNPGYQPRFPTSFLVECSINVTCTCSTFFCITRYKSVQLWLQFKNMVINDNNWYFFYRKIPVKTRTILKQNTRQETNQNRTY